MVTVEFNRLKLEDGFKILDIGCGSGRHTCAAYQCRRVTAIGIDLNLNDLTEARNRLELHDRLGEHGGGRWALAAGNILRLPFKDDCFDLVICSEVLEHIEAHHAAIGEIVRILKPGCDLVVSVPRFWPERICWTLSRDYHNTAGGHVRIFKHWQLIADLHTCGVKKWALHYAHSLHAPFWWLKCLVGHERRHSSAVNLYHRFLVWDMMRRPALTRTLEHLLNPVLGKSVVVYLKKGERIKEKKLIADS
jgi:SAM-dependent methyltransferase